MSLQRDVARLAAQGRSCNQIARVLNASVSVVRELMPAPAPVMVAAPTPAPMPVAEPARAAPVERPAYYVERRPFVPPARPAAPPVAAPAGDEEPREAPRAASDAPPAGNWPKDAPRFRNVDAVLLEAETLWPGFRRRPSPAMRDSGAGSSLGGV